jgi:hypothetical protein
MQFGDGVKQKAAPIALNSSRAPRRVDVVISPHRRRCEEITFEKEEKKCKKK